MKSTFLLTALFALSSILFAQTSRLENRVIDEKGNPLPFAYVIGKSSATATVTDENGKFSFEVKNEFLDSNFLFTYIGFKSLTLSGHEILAAKDGIQMKNNAIALAMVEIKPTKMESVESLLRKIRKNITENYPQEFYRIEGYYREALREKGEFVRYADASFKAELHPYQSKKYKWKDYYSPNDRDIAMLSNIGWSGCERMHRYHFHQQNLKKERVEIINSRASLDNGVTDIKSNIEGGPISIFVKDELKYKSSFLQKKNLNYYDFEINEINVPKHGWVFQLKFKTKLDTATISAYTKLVKARVSYKKRKKLYKQIKGHKGLEGEIWVNKNDFGIVYLNYRVPKEHKEFMCTCGPMTIKHFDFNVAYTFEKKDGRYIPTYVQHQDEFIVKDTNKNEVIPFLANSEYYYINHEYQIEPEIKAVKAFANLDVNQLFDYPLDYDSTFWKNYHLNHAWTKVPDSLVESISKDTALAAQYFLKHHRDTSLKPPIANKKPSQTEIHGYTLKDDYAWLKQVKNPKANDEIMDYLRKENKYTENYFIPLRRNQRNLYKEMLARIDQTVESMPTRVDDYYYSVEYLEEKEYPIYRRKKEGEKEWQIILDVNELAEDLPYYSAGGLQVNPSQNIMSLFENTTGSIKSLLRFRNIDEGVFLDDSLTDVASLVWLSDSTMLYTVQEKKTNRTSKIKFHKLFEPQSEDSLILEEKDFLSSLYIAKSRSKKYVYAGSSSKLDNEIYFMPMDYDSLKFKLIAAREKDVFYEVYDEGDDFYIYTNKFRKNYDLRLAPIDDCDPKNWKLFYKAEKDIILDNYLLFPNHMAIIENDQMDHQLLIMNRTTKEIKKVSFKEKVYNLGISYNDINETDSLTFSFNSMKIPNRTYRMDLNSLEKVKIREDTVKYLPFQKWIAHKRVYAEAKDGTQIPITLLYRKFAKNNKTELKKTYMMAYGSYGSSSRPGFNSTLYSLINRNFIVAIAHVRGGGELGDHWHDEGKMMNKMNTFTDFIACTEYLIENNYAVKGNIVAQGGSAGGLLMGAIANMRPDLYHTIILDVPFVDVINTMLDDELPLTTLEYIEWGNPNIKKHFDYIRSYSPYDNVSVQDYPNMLFFTGINDSQVGYWEPAKMVAKLRANKTDDKLLLLKTNMNAGHGGGSGRFAGLQELAYKYALIFDLLADDFLEKLEEQ